MKRELYISDDFKHKFLCQLKRIMRYAKITQTALGNEIGFSRQSIAKMFYVLDYPIRPIFVLACIQVLPTLISCSKCAIEAKVHAYVLVDDIRNAYFQTERPNHFGLPCSYNRKKNTSDNEGQKP